MERGGIGYCSQGADRYEVFREVVAQLPLPTSFDQDRLFDFFMERDQAGGTAIGGGIVVPHPRYPAIIRDIPAILRVYYIANRLDYHAADGQAINILLISVCPTVTEHLELVNKLVSLFRRADFRTVLLSHPTFDDLIEWVREHEIRLDSVGASTLPSLLTSATGLLPS